MMIMIWHDDGFVSYFLKCFRVVDVSNVLCLKVCYFIPEKWRQKKFFDFCYLQINSFRLSICSIVLHRPSVKIFLKWKIKSFTGRHRSNSTNDKLNHFVFGRLYFVIRICIEGEYTLVYQTHALHCMLCKHVYWRIHANKIFEMCALKYFVRKIWPDM